MMTEDPPPMVRPRLCPCASSMRTRKTGLRCTPHEAKAKAGVHVVGSYLPSLRVICWRASSQFPPVRSDVVYVQANHLYC